MRPRPTLARWTLWAGLFLVLGSAFIDGMDGPSALRFSTLFLGIVAIVAGFALQPPRRPRR